MARQVVLLDCDGVLADFVGCLLSWVAARTGKEFPPSMIQTWDPFESLSHELDVKTLRGQFEQWMVMPGVCSGIAPLREALDGIALIRAAAEIYVVTAPWVPSPTWAYERTAWLRKWFSIDSDHVLHTSAKHLISGDVFVDDKAENVRRWRDVQQQQQPRGGIALLWDTPRAVRDAHAEGLLRVRSWHALAVTVRSRAAKQLKAAQGERAPDRNPVATGESDVGRSPYEQFEEQE